MSNEQFQVVLQDAKTICKLKIASFKASLGETHVELQALIEETKGTFKTFSEPLLLPDDFEFDEISIRISLLEIGEVPDTDYPTFENKMKELLQTFNELTPEAGSPLSEEKKAEKINPRILNALRLTNRRITDRIKKFAVDDDLELNQDAEFIERRERQLPLREKYRKALVSKELVGKGGDIPYIENLGLLVKVTKKKEGFFKVYDKLSNFMEDELKRLEPA